MKPFNKQAIIFAVVFTFSFQLSAFISFAHAAPPQLPPPAKLEFKPPRGERFVLKNGMTVFLLENRALPVIHGTALVRTGSYYDDADKYGVAELVGESLRSGGSAKFDADSMNETLEFLGASVESGMDTEDGSASFTCLSRDLHTVLPIFADILKAPSFRKDKLQVEKQNFLESLRRRNDDPRGIARRESRRALFGADHPYGRRLEAAVISSITRQDLVDFHKRAFRPRAVTLALSGDFETQTMLSRLEDAFADWEDSAPGTVPPIPAVKQPGRKVILIAKEAVTQTAFRIVQASFKRHDPDHFSFEIMNDILGGNSFTSRLFTDIRSRKGLAYGVGSFFAEFDAGGIFGAACGTGNEKAVGALKAILDHIKAIRETPVSDEELALSKNSLISSFIFNYQTPQQIISQRAALEFFGYPPDYLDTYLDQVRTVDKGGVLATAQKRLTPDEAVILLVGPSALKKDLEAFGPVEVRQPD